MNPLKFSFERFGKRNIIAIIKHTKGRTGEPPLNAVVEKISVGCVVTLVKHLQRAEKEEIRGQAHQRNKKGNWSLIKRADPF